jgi:NAD(P)-dependent dehydrogenase (short-subunit alcohol dehydrogenase family)
MRCVHGGRPGEDKEDSKRARTRFGRIVHIDSEVADRPPPGRSAYATPNSAQMGLVRSWPASSPRLVSP